MQEEVERSWETAVGLGGCESTTVISGTTRARELCRSELETSKVRELCQCASCAKKATIRWKIFFLPETNTISMYLATIDDFVRRRREKIEFLTHSRHFHHWNLFFFIKNPKFLPHS